MYLPAFMLRYLALLVVATAVARSLHADDNAVRLNTLGYLPDLPKRATVASPATSFTIVRTSDGKLVFSARLSEAKEDDAERQQPVSVADFSALTEPGTYTLRVRGRVGRRGVSPPRC